LTVPAGQADKRALQFFLEQTAPVMSTFQTLTKTFWESVIPQLAASESSVRHLTIALASRQERIYSASPSYTHKQSLQKVEREHFALSLSSITRGSTIGDMETLLVSSVLFIAYGSFEDLEKQTAQELEHFSSGLKILIEQARQPKNSQRQSTIIDHWVQPMLVRLELIYSLFMSPRKSGAYADVIEPVQPSLPDELTSILQARQIFVEICCFRWYKPFRSQHWNFLSDGFQTIRRLMLDWYKLVVLYADSAGGSSEAEQQRIAIMLSQFRLLFIALIYSARTDLHSIDDHLCPTVVALLKRDQVSLNYDLPERYMQLLPGLDWESQSHQDPLQIRLWPVSQVTSVRSDSASMSLTFYA
jgi:hypothetical protein